MMKLSSSTIQILVTLCVSLLYIVLGIIGSWRTIVKNKFADNETSIVVTDHEFSWLLSMNPIGFTVGSLFSCLVTDYLGRRTTLLACAVPVFLGTIIVVFALKAWLLYVTSFLWSFGTGMAVNVSSLYLAEVVDKEVRGKFTVATKAMFNLGNLLMMNIGPNFSYDTINYCLVSLPVLCLVVCWWIPESPLFYLKEGKRNLARRELIKIRGGEADENLEEELTEKQKHVKVVMAKSRSFKELFVGKQYRKAIIIALGIKFTQVLTGGTTIRNYMGEIMKKSNIPKNSESTVFSISGWVTFVVGIISSLLIDKFGRRPLLIYSYFCTSIFLGLVGVYFLLQNVVYQDIVKYSYACYLPIVAIILSEVTSTIGFNSLVPTLTAEIFPLNIKTSAITLLNVVGGALGFSVSKSYIHIEKNLGPYTVFWFYTSVAFCGGLFSYFVVPETKGKSLSEIQTMLEGKYDEGEVLQELKLTTINVNNDANEIDIEMEELNKKQ